MCERPRSRGGRGHVPVRHPDGASRALHRYGAKHRRRGVVPNADVARLAGPRGRARARANTQRGDIPRAPRHVARPVIHRHAPRAADRTFPLELYCQARTRSRDEPVRNDHWGGRGDLPVRRHRRGYGFSRDEGEYSAQTE